MKKNVLVTGGAGFIGSHVADRLVEAGEKVVILDDLSGGFLDNVNKKAVFIKGSVNNVKLIDEIFKKYKFSRVYHLAAYAAEGLSHFIKRFNYENNLVGSVNLINASVKNGVDCFIFTSSIAVYGKNQLPMSEKMTPQPEDPYGISKYAVELDLEATRRMFGMDYIVFRPHNVYGERQNIGDKYRNVLGIFINNIMQDKPLPVFGDGKQKRAFTYIGDIAKIIAESPSNPKARNQIFNLGADKPYSILDLVEVISKCMEVSPKIQHFDARNEVKFAYSDHSKAKKILNFESTTILEKGVEAMVLWAKNHGPRKSKAFKAIEITSNLPKAWIIK